jgi:hypothetical protein
MRIFIIWSGERSKAVAAGLNEFLSCAIKGCQPWLSYMDIRAGSRWRKELSNALKSSDFGIACVSRVTQTSPWVLFEAGSLSTLLTDRICPYLIDIMSSELVGPLSEFQTREANDKGTWDLLLTLNKFNSKPVQERTLKKRFEKCWPKLEMVIHNAPAEIDTHSYASNYNRLDKIGLLNLLNIHFRATADRLTHVIDQFLSEPVESSREFEILLMNSKRVVNDGRLLLTPFYSDMTGSVRQFLDEHLPPQKLEALLAHGAKLVLAQKDAEKRRKIAYQLIQEEQTKLLEILTKQLT